MAERKAPGRQVMEDLGWSAGPEHLIREIEGQWALFERNGRSNALPAFQALEMIVAQRYRDHGSSDSPFAGINPHETVTIPWWVAWVLSRGWRDYLESNSASTLGQSFRIEGHGQGSHRLTAQLETEMTNRGYALEVAALVVRENWKSTAAWQEVAQKNGVSVATVKKAWKRFGDEAKAKVLDQGKKL